MPASLQERIGRTLTFAIESANRYVHVECGSGRLRDECLQRAGNDLQPEARHTFVSDIASRYSRRLLSFFIQRLRNSADAPDLAQEVFLRLMRVEHYDNIRSPEAYLFTVASHVLNQHTLRQSNTPASIDVADLFAELQLISDDDPLARADAQQRLEQLDRLIAQLPPKLASALLLHRLGGLSIEEIGHAVGVSRPAAKKYLSLALKQCRDAVDNSEKGDSL